MIRSMLTLYINHCASQIFNNNGANNSFICAALYANWIAILVTLL